MRKGFAELWVGLIFWHWFSVLVLDFWHGAFFVFAEVGEAVEGGGDCLVVGVTLTEIGESLLVLVAAFENDVVSLLAGLLVGGDVAVSVVDRSVEGGGELIPCTELGELGLLIVCGGPDGAVNGAEVLLGFPVDEMGLAVAEGRGEDEELVTRGKAVLTVAGFDAGDVGIAGVRPEGIGKAEGVI